MSETLVKSWLFESEDIESLLAIEMNMERYLSRWTRNHSQYHYNSRYTAGSTGYKVIIELYEKY